MYNFTIDFAFHPFKVKLAIITSQHLIITTKNKSQIDKQEGGK